MKLLLYNINTCVASQPNQRLYTYCTGTRNAFHLLWNAHGAWILDNCTVHTLPDVIHTARLLPAMSEAWRFSSLSRCCAGNVLSPFHPIDHEQLMTNTNTDVSICLRAHAMTCTSSCGVSKGERFVLVHTGIYTKRLRSVTKWNLICLNHRYWNESTSGRTPRCL